VVQAGADLVAVRAGMSAAAVVRVVTQREANDCGIVALSMYLGATYEDVFRVAVVSDDTQAKGGLWATTMIAIAKTLGHRLKRRKRIDWKGDYGILRLPDHCAVLRNGLVIDCDATIWEAEAYLKANKVRQRECLLLKVDE
jgi:hypothetical protein